MSGCDTCGSLDARRLYANVDGRRLCSGCWKKAGRPWPRRAADPNEAAATEQKVRERMLKRGGPDRHLARNNKT